jgi:hypothetical protein
MWEGMKNTVFCRRRGRREGLEPEERGGKEGGEREGDDLEQKRMGEDGKVG